MIRRPSATRLLISGARPGSLAAEVADLDGRSVVLVESVSDEHRGALSAADGEKLVDAVRTARAERIPLVALLASSGAEVRDGVPALHGWGRAASEMVATSGIVPQLFAVTGSAVSGSALLLGLADHVVMTRDAYAFVSGPQMVRQFTGVPIDNATLGGPGVHARSTGAATLLADDREAALLAIGDLLAYLPDHTDAEPPRWPTDDDPMRDTSAAADLLPATPTGSYDVRDVLRVLVDDASLLELRASWAPNLVTGFATIDGRPIGIVANQPLALAGTLDIPASQKGARFVAFCDAFNLPLLTAVDTPGFYPGKDLEWRGMIRHGAQLAFAYARATVPRVCLTLRKSYGGAYIVMDSRYMGNDVALAWPSAEIAVMGAKGAVEILHRRATPEERLEQERWYNERLLNPYRAAERGSVDQVIEPADTRRMLVGAFEALATKRERLRPRRHDNMPL